MKTFSRLLAVIAPPLVLALGTLAPGAAAAQAPPIEVHPPVDVQVTVDLSRPGPIIDRHIYGQFSEHLGTGIYGGIWVGKNSPIPNIDGYRKDVVAALRRIKVPVIRWPGGCFADLYDWRDGIGPPAKRPVRINVHWGGVTENNAFGTHEFLNFSELVGADAYVSGNVGSMSPYDMAQWLEYMTSDSASTLVEERHRNGRDKPWQIAYFGIGNETWGCGGNMRAEYAADVNRRYSTFVNAPADMHMIKVASGPTGSRPDTYDFAAAMMRDGGRLQAMSLHYYTAPMLPSADGARIRAPATGFDEEQWAMTLSLALHMEELVTRTSAVMDQYDPDRKVMLAVDEWGSWYAQEPGTHPGFLYQQNTLRDAEVAALTLGIFQRHTERVKLANIAQTINVLQAMILTDGDKMVLTPTYHVFDMFVPFQGATPYPASVAGPSYGFKTYTLPSVDVSAARGTDGKLWLALVNLNPASPAHVTTNLPGTAHGLVLTGPAMDSHNTFAAPDAVHPVAFDGVDQGGKLVIELPARSVAVLAVQ
jgi:alpha-N-arabinofuranosidase